MLVATLAPNEAFAADGETTPVALLYEAPATCPDAEAFRTLVRRRTPRFRENTTDPLAVRVSVRLRVAHAHATGGLEVTAPGGERSSRTLTGASCGELADALALMAALAIDPLAATRPTPAPPAAMSAIAPPPPPPPPPPVPPPPLPPVDLPPAPRAPPPASPPAGLATPSPAPGAPPGPAPRWHLSVGGGAEVSSGITPEALLGPRFFLEATSPPRGVFGWSLRAGFVRSSLSNIPGDSGLASFTWTVGTLDVAPLKWSRGPFALFPSALVEAGELDGRGVSPPPAGEATRGWLALAALARARWTPVRPLSLEIDGGARFPLLRDQFVFTPSIKYYRPPAVSALAGGSIVVTFL